MSTTPGATAVRGGDLAGGGPEPQAVECAGRLRAIATEAGAYS